MNESPLNFGINYNDICRVLGSFLFRKPGVAIFDPKIVKQLGVKDFDSFQDHQVFITEDIDPLLGKLLTVITGQRWKGEFSLLFVVLS